MKKLTLALITILLLSSTSIAQIPQTMSFQGSLVDPNTGLAKSDGTYNMTFLLYDNSESGLGVAFWSEDHNSVAIQNGLFNVILGSQGSDLSSVSFDKPIWLEIIVDSEILSPRIELTASAYSLASSSVQGGENIFPATGDVGIGKNDPGVKLFLKIQEERVWWALY